MTGRRRDVLALLGIVIHSCLFQPAAGACLSIHHFYYEAALCWHILITLVHFSNATECYYIIIILIDVSPGL